MKVYISGPITGTTDYLERFRKAERKLYAAGHSVMNPARVNLNMPVGTTHQEYMKMAICMLGMCDAIFLLDGWAQSAGCNEEVAYALQHKIIITYEAKNEEHIA